MWYCTVCGKKNISDEAKWTCDRCAEIAKELAARGEKRPSLYCHSCGHRNRSESNACERCSYSRNISGSAAGGQESIKVLLGKIDVLQPSIDKLQRTLEDKAGLPDRNIDGNRKREVAREAEPEKEKARVAPVAEETKAKSVREPCPECNPDGDGARKGKCKYCDGAGWWPCTRCGGEGVVKGSVMGILTDNLPKCPKCHGGKWFGCGLCDIPASDKGDGKVHPGDGLCRRCHGTGYI